MLNLEKIILWIMMPTAMLTQDSKSPLVRFLGKIGVIALFPLLLLGGVLFFINAVVTGL